MKLNSLEENLETHSLALTLPIASGQFEEARTRIRAWIHELLDRSRRESDADQIFQLNVQMFLGFRKLS